MGFWDDLGGWFGGKWGKALGIAAAIAVTAYVAGQNIPPSVTGVMTGPPTLIAGQAGIFNVNFTTSPGTTPALAITSGTYEIEITWDGTNSSAIGGFSSTTGTWSGTSSGNFPQSLAFDVVGTETISWEMWLYRGAGSATPVASTFGSWIVVIRP